MVATIKEALARCPRVYRNGSGRHPERCPCNGTGYACGVAPTEVELHLFAIVEATRALTTGAVTGAEFGAYAVVMGLCVAALAGIASNSESLRGAELEALAGRERCHICASDHPELCSGSGPRHRRGGDDG